MTEIVEVTAITLHREGNHLFSDTWPLLRVLTQEFDTLSPLTGHPTYYVSDPLGIAQVEVWPRPSPDVKIIVTII